jgi:hypothetical protein
VEATRIKPRASPSIFGGNKEKRPFPPNARRCASAQHALYRRSNGRMNKRNQTAMRAEQGERMSLGLHDLRPHPRGTAQRRALGHKNNKLKGVL